MLALCTEEPQTEWEFGRESLGWRGFERSDVVFCSGGQHCHAWFYLPTGSSPAPLVVMAHGFAAEKTFALPRFARRFASRGLAVLLFDYRHFGRSEGEPRNFVSHAYQLTDWQFALDYARRLPGVDPRRIALWSTSFGAGHAVLTAASNSDVAAAVLQVPMVDVPRCLGRRLPFVFRALGHGLWDVTRSLAGLERHQIPVVAEPGEFAVMNTPGARTGYLHMLPPNSEWANRCPASVLVASAWYRPIRRAKDVRCPTLVVGGLHDHLCPLRSIQKLAGQLPRGKLVTFEGGHFGPYGGNLFQELARQQADFLCDHLL